jgi:hypothetical protein
MIGEVDYLGTRRIAHRLDRDNNGRWFDPDDRVLIDLNGDEKLDPILERFACEGMQSKGNDIVTLLGDSAGKSLRVEVVREKGQLIPHLTLSNPTAKIISLEGSLASQSGIHIAFNDLDTPLTLPIGKYHVERLRLKVQDESATYWFAFERERATGASAEVIADGSVNFDLIGLVSLEAKSETINSESATTKMITPLLVTASGLFLAGSRKGRLEAVEENRLIARSLFEGKEINLGSSGFS